MLAWYSGDPTYDAVLATGFAFALFVAIAAVFVKSPYGRFADERWGFALDPRLGWLLMELPATLVFVLALNRRVAGLISAHKAGIIGDLPVSKPVFRRGFVEAAEVTATDFVARGAELFERLPLLGELVIWCEREQAPAALCGSPLFARLRGLGLRYARGRFSVQTLADNPALAELERLEILGCGVDVEDCAALAESAHLGSLQALELGSDPILAAGVERLSHAAWAPRLRHLRLWKARLGPGASTAALAGLTSLETLELGFNEPDVAAVDALAALASSLRSLSLRGERLGPALVSALAPLTLTQLDLEGAWIGDGGITALAKLDLSELEILVLSGNKLTNAGARRLAALPLAKLRRLVLRHNELGASSRPFAKKLTHTRVELDAKVWLPGR